MIGLQHSRFIIRFLKQELIQRLIVSYLLKTFISLIWLEEVNIKRILVTQQIFIGNSTKDQSNLYAPLALGTIIAEKGDLNLVKEAFNIVHSSSNDSIPAVLVNLAQSY